MIYNIEESSSIENCSEMKKIISNQSISTSKSNSSESQHGQWQQYQLINEKEEQVQIKQSFHFKQLKYSLLFKNKEIQENKPNLRDPFFWELFLKIERGFHKLGHYFYHFLKEGIEDESFELETVIQITDDWYEFICKAQNLEEIHKDFYDVDCFNVYYSSCPYPSAFWKIAYKIIDFDEYFIKFLIINHFVVEHLECKIYYRVERLLSICDIEKDAIKIQEYKDKSNDILKIQYY